jgi:predicted RNA-binding protein YlqC (UPF0109 family)
MTCEAEELRSFLLWTAYSIARFRDDVTVQAEEDDGAVFLWLSVSPNDYVQFVGTHGSVLRSLRVLMAAIGAKKGVPCKLDLMQCEYALEG